VTNWRHEFFEEWYGSTRICFEMIGDFRRIKNRTGSGGRGESEIIPVLLNASLIIY
jgi:hypothetical protein